MRFRETLALASEAYAITPSVADALIAEGFSVDSRGSGLEPPRQLVWITPERAAHLDATPIALHLDSRLLAAATLALVPFCSQVR
jgi:hypothetical protein